jgi:hypothetical protein
MSLVLSGEWNNRKFSWDGENFIYQRGVSNPIVSSVETFYVVELVIPHPIEEIHMIGFYRQACFHFSFIIYGYATYPIQFPSI